MRRRTRNWIFVWYCTKGLGVQPSMGWWACWRSPAQGHLINLAIGLNLGPRLECVGRMDQARRRSMTTGDPDRAMQLAAELDACTW
ncbi:MAG: hypothetical protein U0800_07135 [Isosphaeraceae bacterium]